MKKLLTGSAILFLAAMFVVGSGLPSGGDANQAHAWPNTAKLTRLEKLRRYLTGLPCQKIKADDVCDGKGKWKLKDHKGRKWKVKCKSGGKMKAKCKG